MRRDSRGFTLIEVLLAILIGSLLLSTIYGVFTSVSDARNRLELEGDAYHEVRIFFDRLGSELRSLRLAPVGNIPLFATGQTTDGELYFEFTTEVVSPLLQQRGGLSRVRYELRKEGDTETLYRSEQAALANLAPSEALPFISGVKNFQLRYYKDGSWQTEWSSSNLPQEIEISFELQLEDQVIPFRSSFSLEG